MSDSPELQKDLKKHEEKVKNNDYNDVAEQIQTENSIAKDFIKSKWNEWVTRLTLYNNQKKDKTKIGDPLIFTIHQTVLASLYDDRLQAEFLGRERGDDTVAENLNLLAEYDQDEMMKDELDYDWDWDTTFFGRGLCLFMEYDPDTNTPIPEIIDPLTFFRDPRAKSVHGDRKGNNALRFCGRELRLTRLQLENGKGKVYNLLNSIDDLKSSNALTDVDRNRQLRFEAQGYPQRNSNYSLTGDNQEYVVYEWFTYHKGKLCLVTLTSDFKKVIRYLPLDYGCIPILDRTIYPIAHEWDGVSVPDLTEDKQRMKARAGNLAMDTVTSAQYPMYLFNSNSKVNKNALSTFEFNKFIEVDGDPNSVLAQVPRANVKADVEWIMNYLENGAQKATATPEIQQGVTSANVRSATELSLVSKGVSNRYSLSAKIFSWSERKFWKQWYSIYKKHFKECNEKVVRLRGAMGAEWRPLSRQDIIPSNDPDIKVESKVVADQERQVKLQIFGQYMGQALASEPTANKRFALKMLGKLSGMTTDEINRLLPKTFDEMEAEKENEILDQGKMVKVTPNQDHITHLEIHSRATDNPAKKAHIEIHNAMLFMMREKPQLFPQKQPNNMPPPGAPTPQEMAPDYSGVNTNSLPVTQ